MTKWNRRDLQLPLLLLLLSGIGLLAAGLAVPWATSIDTYDEHGHTDPLGAAQVLGRHIPDVRLTDQNGHQVSFLSDVLRRRTALISFIYTGCSSTCPLVGATVATVAEDLQRDNPDVAIVSVSVDPDWDTPERLLAWRELYGDIPQWTLLTGPRPEVEQLLRSLGAYSTNLEDHSDILLVGPDSAGQWMRMSSLAAPAEVAGAVRAATGLAR